MNLLRIPEFHPLGAVEVAELEANNFRRDQLALLVQLFHAPLFVGVLADSPVQFATYQARPHAIAGRKRSLRSETRVGWR